MRPLLVASILAFFVSGAFAQPWTYDFGSTTGVYNIPSDTSSFFLPHPPSGGGSDRVRVGSGGGGHYLETSSYSTDPTGVRLRIAASSNGSTTKFSIHNYSSPTSTFTIRFNAQFTGGTNGEFQFFVGDGSTYNDNNGFNGSQVFTGLRFQYSAGSVTMNNRLGSNWVSTGLTSTAIAKDTDYYFHIYGNNSGTTASYTDLVGNLATVGPYKFDLYINEHLIGDDLGKALLPNGNNIDSWMFIGINSTGSTSQLILDDFVYTNSIATTPLPVELTEFTAVPANGDVALNWQTASELNNQYFLLQYSADGHNWQTIQQLAGAGTTNEPQFYSYIHQFVQPGYAYYQLIQVDDNGQENHSDVVTVFVPSSSNFPVISNPIGDQISLPSGYELSLYDLQGRMVLYNLSNGSGIATATLQPGVYVATLRNDSGEQTLRLIKQ